MSKIIRAIGEAAGVKVASDPATGKTKCASTHDLRRSFGERWAMRLQPLELMDLMRHESLNTTRRFYVGRNAQRTARALWETYLQGTRGNISGNIGRPGPTADPMTEAANDYAARF